MKEEGPVKPETKDPLKEGIDHPDGPGLEEMIYGAEEPNNIPIKMKKTRISGR